MKNTKLIISFLVTIIVAITSCKKSAKDTITVPPEPLKTAKGVAQGSPVTKVIGSAGGDITSDDGKLKVIVPSGAVNANTTFSIQPITNTLFGDENKVAYRLLPEGSQFLKPVQLVFTYNASDTVSTKEDLMTVTWQRADRAWAVLPSRIDKAAKTLTVETTHFSDWTITGGLYLESDTHVLGLGKKTEVRIISISKHNNQSPGTDDDDLLTPLEPNITAEDRSKIEYIGNWRVAAGVGSILARTGPRDHFNPLAEYSAPASMTGNKSNVTVTVEVRGYNMIKDPTGQGGVRRLNQMILFEHFIVAKEYMKGTFGGEEFEFVGNEVGCERNQLGAIVFVGVKGDFSGLTLSAMGQGTGTYPCDQTGTVITWIPSGSNPLYNTSWFECNQLGVYIFHHRL